MFKERASLFVQAFRDTRGLARRELLDAVFFCSKEYVHSYYVLLKDLRKDNRWVK